MRRKLSICCTLTIIFFIFSSGCVQDNDMEYKVTINLLYSQPNLINNTTVYLDGDIILQFKNYSLETYPPHLGSKTLTLSRDSHELKVTDNNYNQTKIRSITVDKRLYINIIIGDDYIDIDLSEKQTGYK